jgi:hypothetical protein
MLIEDLIDFDKKNLTYWKLITSKHSKLFNVLNFLSIGIASISIVFPLLYLPSINKMPFALIGIILSIISIKKTREKTYKLLKNRYDRKYNLYLNEKWNYKTIRKIQYLKLAEYFKYNTCKVKKDDIPLIIESLKYERKQYKYSFKSSKIVIPFTIAFLSVIISTTFNLFENFKIQIEIVKYMSGLFLSLILFFITMELVVIRPFIITRNMRFHRLIRALENYYCNY